MQPARSAAWTMTSGNWYWPSGKSAASAASLIEHLHIECSSGIGVTTLHGTFLTPRTVPKHGTRELMSSSHSGGSGNWYWPSGKSAASAASLIEHLHIECSSGIGVTTLHSTFLTPRTVPKHGTRELMSSSHMVLARLGLGTLVLKS